MGNAILTSRGGSGGNSGGSGAIGDIKRSQKTDLGDNYLLCNGEAIWEDQYPELFEVLDNENSYTSMIASGENKVEKVSKPKYIPELDMYVFIAVECTTDKNIMVYWTDSESIRSNIWNKNLIYAYTSYGNTSNAIYSIDFEYAFGKFFVSYTRYNNTGVYILSSDTIDNDSWTSTLIGTYNTKFFTQLFYRNNTLIAISYQSSSATIQYTTDGSTWSSQFSPSTYALGSIINIIYFNDNWIIAGHDYIIGGGALGSANSFSLYTSGTCNSFDVFNNIIITAFYSGTTGSLSYSMDGKSFYSCSISAGGHVSETNRSSFCVSQYDSDYVYMVMNAGMYISIDGKTWSFVGPVTHGVYGFNNIYYDDNGWKGIGVSALSYGINANTAVVTIDDSDIRTLPTIASKDTEYVYIKAKE